MHATQHRIGGLIGVFVTLLVAVMVALSGTASADGPAFQEVGWGQGLCSGATWLRSLNLPGIGPKGNIAVFKVNLNWEHPEATPNYAEIAMPSMNPRWAKNFKFRKLPANLLNNGGSSIYEPPINGDSEQRLNQALNDAGVPPKAVVDVCSEYEPCSSGPNCKAMLVDEDDFSNLEAVEYNFPFPGGAPKGSPQWVKDNQIKAESRAAHEAAVKADTKAQKVMNDNPCSTPGSGDVENAVLQRKTLRAPSGFSLTDDCEPSDDLNTPSDEPVDGPLTNELSDPAGALDPGGIDFTSLQLRYLSLSGPHQGDVQYAMDSDGAPVTKNPGTGLETAEQDSAAFFTWLTLPQSTFWVNLAPNYPPQIIDPRLGLTDAGRVMLQSDLLLKEAAVAALNPATPVGAQMWQRLVALPPGSGANPGNCIWGHEWIVPGVATVHATKTQLYILSAPLKVRLAPLTHLPGKLLTPFCPQSVYQTTYETAYRQLVQPELTQEVNTAPQFEPLRRIYMSRVAAQWVRQEAGPHTVMGQLVDSGLHRNWISQPSWSSYALWQEFMKRLDTPTYYTVPVPDGATTVGESLPVYGGVDLRHKVRMKNTSNRQFRAHWRGLAAAAKESSKRPSKAAGTTLVGGGTSLRRRPRIVTLHKRLLFVFVPRGV